MYIMNRKQQKSLLGIKNRDASVYVSNQSETLQIVIVPPACIQRTFSARALLVTFPCFWCSLIGVTNRIFLCNVNRNRIISTTSSDIWKPPTRRLELSTCVENVTKLFRHSAWVHKRTTLINLTLSTSIVHDRNSNTLFTCSSSSLPTCLPHHYLPTFSKCAGFKKN